MATLPNCTKLHYVFSAPLSFSVPEIKFNKVVWACEGHALLHYPIRTIADGAFLQHMTCTHCTDGQSRGKWRLMERSAISQGTEIQPAAPTHSDKTNLHQSHTTPT